MECIRNYMLTGVSAAMLGHTMADVPVMTQIADLGGSYAVSFVVAIVNAMLFLKSVGGWFCAKATSTGRFPVGQVSSRNRSPLSLITLLLWAASIEPTDSRTDDHLRADRSRRTDRIFPGVERASWKCSTLTKTSRSKMFESSEDSGRCRCLARVDVHRWSSLDERRSVRRAGR